MKEMIGHAILLDAFAILQARWSPLSAMPQHLVNKSGLKDGLVLEFLRVLSGEVLSVLCVLGFASSKVQRMPQKKSEHRGRIMSGLPLP